MSKLTAIEILEIKLLGIVSFDSEVLRNKYKEQFKIAKEIEKWQIKEAYMSALPYGLEYSHYDKYANKYYNEIYKKEDK
jgi:hypothetical protein